MQTDFRTRQSTKEIILTLRIVLKKSRRRGAQKTRQKEEADTVHFAYVEIIVHGSKGLSEIRQCNNGSLNGNLDTLSATFINYMISVP